MKHLGDEKIGEWWNINHDKIKSPRLSFWYCPQIYFQEPRKKILNNQSWNGVFQTKIRNFIRWTATIYIRVRSAASELNEQHSRGCSWAECWTNTLAYERGNTRWEVQPFVIHIMKVNKLRTMRWVPNVACVGEIWIICYFSVQPTQRLLKCRKRNNIKMVLRGIRLNHVNRFNWFDIEFNTNFAKR